MQPHDTPEQIPTKQCTRCKERKPLTVFPSNKTCSGGREGVCNKCRAQRRKSGPPPELPTPAGFRRCTKCAELKPATIEYFNAGKRYKGGWRSQCKECERAYNERNKDRVRKRRSAHRAANKDRIAERYRIWAAANREHRNAYNRKYHAKQRAKTKADERAWYVGNTEEINTATRNRRARAFKAEGIHTADDVRRQHKAQRGKCYYCGVKVGKMYHVDHVIPLSRGGSNGPENIVIACQFCNTSKQSKMPHEWGGSNRLL